MKRLLCVVWFQRLTVTHSPTTAIVKWLLCVVWFQRLTVTHSLTTAIVKWLLSRAVWFQRLTVTHLLTTAIVKRLLCVVWFQRLTVTHSPTTAVVKRLLCVVWFQRLTVTHSVTTAIVKWLLWAVWFQRLTVTHAPTIAIVKCFLRVVWFQRLTATHSPTTAIGSPCPSPSGQWVPTNCGTASTSDQPTSSGRFTCSQCCVHRPVYSYNWGILCPPKFSEYMKIRKFPPKYNHKSFYTCFAIHLFSSPEYAQFLVFGGTCVSLTSSHSCSFSFCVGLSVVLALNSQAIQIKACISAAKYEHSPFFWKLCWNYFQIIFTENKRNREKKLKYSNCTQHTIRKCLKCTCICIWV